MYVYSECYPLLFDKKILQAVAAAADNPARNLTVKITPEMYQSAPGGQNNSPDI